MKHNLGNINKVIEDSIRFKMEEEPFEESKVNVSQAMKDLFYKNFLRPRYQKYYFKKAVGLISESANISSLGMWISVEYAEFEEKFSEVIVQSDYFIRNYNYIKDRVKFSNFVFENTEGIIDSAVILMFTDKYEKPYYVLEYLLRYIQVYSKEETLTAKQVIKKAVREINLLWPYKLASILMNENLNYINEIYRYLIVNKLLNSGVSLPIVTELGKLESYIFK